jgi:hypothetical protein
MFFRNDGLIFNGLHGLCPRIQKSSSNKKLWEELIAHLALTPHGPHRKRRLRHSFYYFVCIRCRGNVLTKPLPSNDKRIHTQKHRLMGGIYEVGRWDGFRYHDVYTIFIKIGSAIQKLIGGGDTQTYRQHGDCISLPLFFLNKEHGLKVFSHLGLYGFMYI